ncbi:helix-turn-helix transcriptional regulator [Planococcus maritimus]|nr:helix-turn-helix transcriptional regulator [Planococcus sp. SK3692]MDE4086437.1 helix-turn-helix transcriptional regulator [Planococcus maritimus]
MIGLEYIVKEFHLGYREVANILEISPQTIQDWLKKRRGIPEKRLEQLASTFNVPKDFFQKELNSIEKAEVSLSYLKSISENIEIPFTNDEEQAITYYNTSSHADEILFMEKILEKKKKQLKIKDELYDLFENDLASMSEVSVGNISPVHSDSSNTETVFKVLEILKGRYSSDLLKVIIYLMNTNLELGGKPETRISPEYRVFAKDFLDVLKKHQLSE